jgi:hypothetical protein
MQGKGDSMTALRQVVDFQGKNSGVIWGSCQVPLDAITAHNAGRFAMPARDCGWRMPGTRFLSASNQHQPQHTERKNLYDNGIKS